MNERIVTPAQIEVLSSEISETGIWDEKFFALWNHRAYLIHLFKFQCKHLKK